MKQKILVTGGIGYIGSHTVTELLEKGFEVVIVDNLSNSSLEIYEGMKQISGKNPPLEIFDLCEESKTDQFFQKYQDIVAIIHFAAFKSVSESVQKPLRYYHNNLLSLIHLLKGMQKYSIPHFLFSSSCTVYGEPDRLPVDEHAPFQGAASPYGNTKQISEEIIQDFLWAEQGKNCISLRYFNPIGAHPSALIGELPSGVPDNLVPYITQTAAGIREELKVFGNDYNTPDGSCIRDYIHVLDLARAHVHALEKMISGKCKSSYEVFNIGTGKGVSVLELIRAFEKATGIDLPITITGRRPGDVEKVWADTSLANRELEWEAIISLEEALLSAWNWEKKRGNKNNYL